MELKIFLIQKKARKERGTRKGGREGQTENSGMVDVKFNHINRRWKLSNGFFLRTIPNHMLYKNRIFNIETQMSGK